MNSTCIVCAKPGQTRRGMCDLHYRRAKRRGELSPLPSCEERFWSRVNKTNGGCWLWTAGISTGGYGQFSMNGKMNKAHRVAWSWIVGPIPPGMVLDHDNPDRGCGNPSCVNPDHLELVPQRVNNRRRRGPQTNNHSSGVLGVTWSKLRSKWVVQVTVDGKTVGGYFTDLGEAEKKAEQLRSRLHAWGPTPEEEDSDES